MAMVGASQLVAATSNAAPRMRVARPPSPENVCLIIEVLLLETGDTLGEQAAQAAAGQVAQAMQRQLEENAPVLSGVLFDKFVIVDPVTGNQAQGGTAVTVFDTRERFKVPVVAVIVVPATEQTPIVIHWPDAGNVSLADPRVQQRRRIKKDIGLFAVPIGKIEDAAVVG